MKNIYARILLVMLLFASNSVFSQGHNTAIKETVDATTFKSKLDATPQGVILDVRTPDEVNAGEIPGAVNIDFNANNFKRKLSALDKEKTYFVYCAKGGRSSRAADLMNSLGFKTIYNLDGGFDEWKAKGMPVKK